MMDFDKEIYTDLKSALTIVAFVFLAFAILNNLIGGENTVLSTETSSLESWERIDYSLTDREVFEVDESGYYSVRSKARSLGNKSHLEVYKDGERVFDNDIGVVHQQFSTPFKYLEEGSQIIIENNCLSECSILNMEEFHITSFEDQPESLLYTFGDNWYTQSDGEDRIWSKGNSSIHIYNYDSVEQNETVRIYLASFPDTRNITYRLNGEELGTKVVPARDYRLEFEQGEEIVHPWNYPVNESDFEGTKYHRTNKYHFDISLNPGENILELETGKECVKVGEINNNNDLRCSSFGFKDLYFVD